MLASMIKNFDKNKIIITLIISTQLKTKKQKTKNQEKKMIFASQIFLFILLVPWLIELIFPFLQTKLVDADAQNWNSQIVQSQLFMVLLLWIYSYIRTWISFVEYIPVFTNFEFLFLCLLCLRSTMVLQWIQIHSHPYEHSVSRFWNNYKHCWGDRKMCNLLVKKEKKRSKW